MSEAKAEGEARVFTALLEPHLLHVTWPREAELAARPASPKEHICHAAALGARQPRREQRIDALHHLEWDDKGPAANEHDHHCEAVRFECAHEVGVRHVQVRGIATALHVRPLSGAYERSGALPLDGATGERVEQLGLLHQSRGRARLAHALPQRSAHRRRVPGEAVPPDRPAAALHAEVVSPTPRHEHFASARLEREKSALVPQQHAGLGDGKPREAPVLGTPRHAARPYWQRRGRIGGT
eukprot:CAMPEP_0119397136 /NCGR_PEP_ID=MMETSP1334-20130426/139745_1 /TAXON_ID=127549 /ORGANISM="Calcidiscus leptoporus, Strain RCC1130" /LENGTH=240 /DNA_ID=CAMNT_0007420937 /DNA_START=161 /DNA_END=881 /DNA_ORIENTATION=+